MRIRLSFVKTSEFRRGKFEHPKQPSVGHCCKNKIIDMIIVITAAIFHILINNFLKSKFEPVSEKVTYCFVNTAAPNFAWGSKIIATSLHVKPVYETSGYKFLGASALAYRVSGSMENTPVTT
jgi:hypothetical protein